MSGSGWQSTTFFGHSLPGCSGRFVVASPCMICSYDSKMFAASSSPGWLSLSAAIQQCFSTDLCIDNTLYYRVFQWIKALHSFWKPGLFADFIFQWYIPDFSKEHSAWMLNMLLWVVQDFNSKTQLKPLKESVVINWIFPFCLVEKGQPSFVPVFRSFQHYSFLSWVLCQTPGNAISRSASSGYRVWVHNK